MLVTGGTRGIGAGIARAFLAAGADVLVCGRTAPAGLPAVAGRGAVFARCDVRDAGAGPAAGPRRPPTGSAGWTW